MCLEAFAVEAAADSGGSCDRRFNRDRINRDRFDPFRNSGRGVDPALFRRGIEPTMNPSLYLLPL